MNKNLSNFSFLNGTKLEPFYRGSVKAEYACDDFPEMSKITLRMVVEDFLRMLARRYNINSNVSTGVIVKNLKTRFPVEIYMAIQAIRVNGIGLTLYRSRDKKVDKEPLELLKLIHNIFCWYLETIERISCSSIKFTKISKSSVDALEIRKIRDDINLKENQINNLREKIIDLASKSKNVSELNKIIIAIKNEKRNQEKILKELLEIMDDQRRILDELEEENEIIQKKIYNLMITCRVSHEQLAQKESQLIRAEADYQKLKKSINNLDENNSQIKDKAVTIERLLELVRTRYDKILELTNRNQDIMESIEFTSDYNLKKKLKTENNAITNELSNEDKFFSQYISNYTNKIEEAEGKLKIFNDILNDRIRSEVKDKELYKSFLNLNNTSLKLIYGFVKYYAQCNTASKAKEWFSKYSINTDKFKNDFDKSLENLKNIDDNQLKLILYYDLIKMSKINPNFIYKRKEFVKQFDKFIDVAYDMLMSKKEFNYVDSKIDSIKIYYLKQFINVLGEKCKFTTISNKYVNRIYDYILEINSGERDFIPDKYNMNHVTEEHIKSNVAKKPFEALGFVTILLGNKHFIEIYELVLEILKSNNEEKIFGHFDIHVTFDKFLSGPYRMYLLVQDNHSILSDATEAFPLIICEILINGLAYEESEEYIETYNNMVEIWKKNQEVYSDLFIKRQKVINDISKRGIEKVEFEIKLKNLLQHKHDLNYASKRVEEEFEELVINSNKLMFLPSYAKYKRSIEKKDEFEDNSKDKNNGIKSNVMDAIVKKINSSSIKGLKKALINEAKVSESFNNEYSQVKEVKNRLLVVERDMITNKKYVKEKNKELADLTTNKQTVEKQMLAIKRLYLDMHEQL